MQMPVPNRIVLNLAANSRRSILRDIASLAAQDLGLHAVGFYNFLTEPDQGMIETRLASGILMLDGCISGIESPYIMVARLVHPVSMEGGAPYPVELVMVVISPDSDHSGHVRRMNGVTRLLKHQDTFLSIRVAVTMDQVMSLFLTDHVPSVRAA